MKDLAARLLFAVALLLAQQAALAHQIWHAGTSDAQPAQGQLCEKHAALSTVAGALDCASLELPVVPNFEDRLVVLPKPAALAPALAPTSRSPPRSLR